MRVPKFPKFGFLQLWGLITLCADLRLKWGLKKSCSLRREFSNNMSLATWTWGNRGDSQLLVVGSQTVNLTFGHNLGFRCPNGSWELTSNIYVSIGFQWYNELFNLMGFDPWNGPLKIQESIGTSTPKMGVHLGVWRFIPSHSFALSKAWDVTRELPFWPTTL
jgi:hypothetical protein